MVHDLVRVVGVRVTFRRTFDHRVTTREVLRRDARIVQFRETVRTGRRTSQRHASLPAPAFDRWARDAERIDSPAARSALTVPPVVSSTRSERAAPPFAANLTALMEREEIGTAVVAEILGCSQRTARRLADGFRSPSASEIQEIADAFDVDPGELAFLDPVLWRRHLARL